LIRKRDGDEEAGRKQMEQRVLKRKKRIVAATTESALRCVVSPVLAYVLFRALTCFLWLSSVLDVHPIDFLSHRNYNVLHPEPQFHATHLSPH